MRPLLVVMAVAIAVGAIIGGLALDAGGFAGNLLAEVAGLVIGVVLAVTIVEQWLARERTRRWARVRLQTLRAIYADATDVAFHFAMQLPTPRDGIEAYQFGVISPAEVAAEMRKVAATIHGQADRLGVEFDPDSVVVGKVDDTVGGRVFVDSEASKAQVTDMFLDTRSTRSLHNDVVAHFRQLRDVLTPRVIELADDPRLVELLGDVDEAERRWVGNIETIEGWGMPEKHGWETASEVLERLADLVEHLPAELGARSLPLEQ